MSHCFFIIMKIINSSTAVKLNILLKNETR